MSSAMAKRTTEQNRRYYEARVRKARQEGFTGYGQKRGRLEKTRAILRDSSIRETDRQDAINRLMAEFPGAELFTESYSEAYPARARALDYLEAKGYEEDELDELRESDNFWEEVRPLLEKESA